MSRRTILPLVILCSLALVGIVVTATDAAPPSCRKNGRYACATPTATVTRTITPISTPTETEIPPSTATAIPTTTETPTSTTTPSAICEELLGRVSFDEGVYWTWLWQGADCGGIAP